MATEKKCQVEWYAGAVFFVLFVGAHLTFGVDAAIKVGGVAAIATGILWIFRRSVPVGIEGRKPSFFLQGMAAVLMGLTMAGIGAYLIIYSELAACLLGWLPIEKC